MSTGSAQALIPLARSQPAEATSTPPADPAAVAAPLALRALKKRWRADQPPVLDHLDLTLEPGTITWVGGRNGAEIGRAHV